MPQPSARLLLLVVALGPRPTRSQARHDIQRTLEYFSLTTKHNVYENVYHHMAQLRRFQPPSLIIGHIAMFPMQAFKYYWIVRHVAMDRALAGLPPPTTCEIGFGSGMSTAIFLTATSDTASPKRGGTHYNFDCPHCGGVGEEGKQTLTKSKNLGFDYLFSVFGGDRLKKIVGPSHEQLPKLALEQPGLTCDVLSIDGDHSITGITRDIHSILFKARSLWSNKTVVLFDDLNKPGPKTAVSDALAKGWLYEVERLTADTHFDEYFAAQFAAEGSPEDFPRQGSKTFLEARFNGNAQQAHAAKGVQGGGEL